MSLTNEEIYEHVETLYQAHYLGLVEDQMSQECDHMLAIIAAAEIQEVEGATDDHRRIAARNEKLHQLINQSWDLPEKKPLAEIYPKLFEAWEIEMESCPLQQVDEQSRDRFYPLVGDSIFLRLLKMSKRSLLILGQLPRRFVNLFRKEKRALHYWSHTIPMRNLVQRHYGARLIEDLEGLTDHFFGGMVKEYLTVKAWQETMALDATHAAVSSVHMTDHVLAFKKKWSESTPAIIAEIFAARRKAFEQEYERAGTWEYAKWKLSDTKVAGWLTDAHESWSRHQYEWKNTIYAVFEDWRSDLDIYILQQKTLAELSQYQEAQRQKLTKYIDPDIDKIQQFITDSLDGLGQPQESILKELKRLHYQTVKQLDQSLVPQLSEKLSSQNIVGHINKLEVTVSQLVSELSEEHIILKSGDYDRPLKHDDFHQISIDELITFETLVVFQNELARFKTQMFSVLESAADETKDLDHIITFSLSSAIASLDDEKSDQEVILIAEEGFQRASSRLSEIREKLQLSLSETSDGLEAAVQQFCDSLTALTHNENTRELKMRITKAKAARQAVQVREELQDRIKGVALQLWEKSKVNYTVFRAELSKWSGRFILTANKPELTKQVSDFLYESQQALDKLPLIYQRLYQIEPLEDLELFEGRAMEYEALQSAFKNWKLGRYGATVVLGEKWGGLTSFMNYAVKEVGFTHSVSRHALEGNLYSHNDFITMMCRLFQLENIQNMDELVSHFHQGPKRVIVLEDIQKMYLRKVDGFQALIGLNQLISRTGQHIFWVVTSTIYTWNYLSQTIQINQYFSYIIELKELTNDQIINIVWKRNKISGYNIQFEVEEERSNDKKFMKLTSAQQQDKLKQEFFSSLNSFAKSNVSMALIFWLLSTRKIEDNRITIGTFKNPNLGFLKALSMEKVYILHVLILHDGLNVAQISEVLNIPQTHCQLMLLALLEDGVVFEEKSTYMINPIVYRGMINLLKSKNLIH
ncbi:hypothetical protein [Reichenbachiella sp. MSK19-1]|uniref:hypothetical protein n=1 Tax=Reichenbachiella sp. MSK19-1 TaxID=1897631 RepID=UPI000E6D1353|nr:hypothetical protein [Reichenbachiella sp. MSK19-1]RJE74931.1 hypothetical protein BGP76_17570 [Reichenbachiella sp. MSK19-1]